MAPERVILEHVHSMPSDGHVGAFRFGDSFGVIRGVLGALGLQPVLIAPAEWKPAIGAPADKRKSRARASELFPGQAHLWKRAKDDGRAEAAMLGLYALKRRLDKLVVEW